MICMLKIAVIGGRETVMGFKALGLETYPAADAAEAGQTLRHLTRDSDDYAIIYIEENLAAQLSHEIDKFKDRPTPAIILIPGREGSIGLGQSALKAAVEGEITAIRMILTGRLAGIAPQVIRERLRDMYA